MPGVRTRFRIPPGAQIGAAAVLFIAALVAFEPFSTSKAGGTGLRLAIAHETAFTLTPPAVTTGSQGDVR